MMEERPGSWETSSDGRTFSSASTPFVSATCSPRSSTDQALSCFVSASTPASPVKLNVDVESSAGIGILDSFSKLEETASEDFDFSARFSEADQPWPSTPMSSADELFCNGQIRPLWSTGEDLYHSYFSRLEHAGDDSENVHYFRSSADYKFTILSQQQLYASAMDQYGLSSRYHDHQVSVVKATNCVEANGTAEGQVVQTKAEHLPRQKSKRLDVTIVSKPVLKAKTDDGRGRRSSGGSIRRTRSLSPLRVFHMDDEFLKQPIEKQSVILSPDSGNDRKAAECKERREGNETPRRGTRVTLKELLHANDKGHPEVASKKPAGVMSKPHRKSHVEMKANELKPRSPPRQASEDIKNVPNRMGGPGSRHYSSPNIHTERMRRQTFLPYRHGLLACLGFSSKSYRSVAGMRSLHSNP